VTGQLIPLMDRQREVALALSSCPLHSCRESWRVCARSFLAM
jgi:hypothetical protein